MYDSNILERISSKLGLELLHALLDLSESNGSSEGIIVWTASAGGQEHSRSSRSGGMG